jgi:uncharacterized membrane protein
MRTIKLTRPNEKFNSNTSYIVLDSNGKKLDTLPNDTSIELNISDDVTFIQVKVAWCGTGKIFVPHNNQNTELMITSNRFFNGYLIYSGAFFVLIGLLFNQGEVIKILGMVIRILLIVFVVLSATLWKNKWLNHQVIRP